MTDDTSAAELPGTARIPCPFVYANRKPCPGHIIRVETYGADIAYLPDEAANWRVTIGQTRSHFHVFCSEKGNHAGYGRDDDERMKFYFGDLPAPLRAALNAAWRHVFDTRS